MRSCASASLTMRFAHLPPLICSTPTFRPSASRIRSAHSLCSPAPLTRSAHPLPASASVVRSTYRLSPPASRILSAHALRPCAPPMRSAHPPQKKPARASAPRVCSAHPLHSPSPPTPSLSDFHTLVLLRSIPRVPALTLSTQKGRSVYFRKREKRKRKLIPSRRGTGSGSSRVQGIPPLLQAAGPPTHHADTVAKVVLHPTSVSKSRRQENRASRVG